MKQEAMEIDMEFFSKHVGPYFTWLESKIESGWEQSESIQKDVLKEVRYVSTNMRARFILGVSRDDFSKEAARTLELLELAAEAFPAESDEVESKIKFFCRAITTELGDNVVPQKYRGMNKAEVIVKATPIVEAPKMTVKVEPVIAKPVVTPPKPMLNVPAAPVVQMKPTVKPVVPKVVQAKKAEKPAVKVQKPAIMQDKKPVVAKKPAMVKKVAPAKKMEKTAVKTTKKPAKEEKSAKPSARWNKVKAWIKNNLPKRF